MNDVFDIFAFPDTSSMCKLPGMAYGRCGWYSNSGVHNRRYRTDLPVGVNRQPIHNHRMFWDGPWGIYILHVLVYVVTRQGGSCLILLVVTQSLDPLSIELCCWIKDTLYTLAAFSAA